MSTPLRSPAALWRARSGLAAADLAQPALLAWRPKFVGALGAFARGVRYASAGEAMTRHVAFALLALGCAANDPTTGPVDAASDADADADVDTDVDTTAAPAPGHYFPDGAPWYQPVTGAAVDPDSATMISALQAAGWGTGNFQIDFSFEILSADASTPRKSYTSSYGYDTVDCDNVPIPVPTDGNVEGEAGYACESDGDCHLLVADWDAMRLYELWRADLRGDQFSAACNARWDMTRVYPPEGRGDQCTSADAAGYPIAPLLFTADEVAAGEIDHAIRFALPNASIRDGAYYHPASHATNADGGGAEAIPYGARLRLKPDFDLTRLTDPDARVIAVALQKYGMFLADGGNIALMGESDRRAVAKWDALLDDGSHAMFGIEPQDFEVLALAPPEVPLTFACVRNGL